MRTALIILLIIAIIVAVWWYFTRQSNPATVQNNVDMLSNGSTLDVTAQEVLYLSATNGYFVRPQAQGRYPGIVMIHEWWGLNDNIKQMARQLAGEGYMVLAVDLHKGQVATTQEQARALTSALNQQEANANLRAAAEYLRTQGAQTIASLGWCFGGGQSLQLALSGEDLDATVIYYGQLVTETARLRVLSWPVLGIFGGEDTSIPVENVRSFETALDGAGVENEIYIYPGVGHAFANPSGANYAPSETMDAWQKTLAFLELHLKGNQL